MSSETTQFPPGDPRCTNEIVERVKSQGLFDLFRRDCLADVDTKPAYQNLKQRVENYVAKFLSKQTWSTSLNKNKLRDQLRTQIIQSGMLLSGVESIVDQVINPKVNSVFKPQVDKVVCEYLGIDPEERRKSQEENRAKQMGFSSPNYNPNMINKFGSPPPFQQMGPNFGMPFPGPSGPSLFPYMGNQSHSAERATESDDNQPPPPGEEPPLPPLPADELPPPPPEIEPPPLPPGPDDEVADVSNMDAEDMDIDSEASGSDMDIECSSKESSKDDDESQTDEIPLPQEEIPLPQEEIPLPHEISAEDIPLPPSDNNTVNNIPLPEDKTDMKDNLKESDLEMEIITEEIPLPMDDEHDMHIEENKQLSESEVSQDSSQSDGERQQTSKRYSFVWEQEADDALSSISVSSVHTSDLSSYEESESEEDKQKEEITRDEEEEKSEELVDVKPGEEIVTDMKSPRLISLQYNYSDDENDETREERKARIAKEKEDRYLSRQQRRAEILIKQKEREEDRKSRRKEREEKKKREEENERISDEENSEDTKTETESPKKIQRRTKQVLKDQLREKKVLEKKMALRTSRERKRNRKYTSEEFDSYFKNNTSQEETIDTSQEDTSLDVVTTGEVIDAYDDQLEYQGIEYTSNTEDDLNQSNIESETIPTEGKSPESQPTEESHDNNIQSRLVPESDTISTEPGGSQSVDIQQSTDNPEIEQRSEEDPYIDIPGTPTMDEPGTPTQDEPTIPGTPTRDEIDFADADEKQNEQTRIPIYELSPTKSIGQFVHYTRSKSQVDEMAEEDTSEQSAAVTIEPQEKETSMEYHDPEKPPSRPVTPSSVFSDASKSESIGDVQQPRRSQRRRTTVDSVEEAVHETRSRSSMGADDKSRPTSRGSNKSQRYESSDLYKPRISRRRSSPTSSTSSLSEQTVGTSVKSPEETVDERDDREKNRPRMPIEEVSFGEAERRIRDSPRGYHTSPPHAPPHRGRGRGTRAQPVATEVWEDRRAWRVDSPPPVLGRSQRERRAPRTYSPSPTPRRRSSRPASPPHEAPLPRRGSNRATSPHLSPRGDHSPSPMRRLRGQSPEGQQSPPQIRGRRRSSATYNPPSGHDTRKGPTATKQEPRSRAPPGVNTRVSRRSVDSSEPASKRPRR